MIYGNFMDIIEDDVVNGEGIRVTLFVSGCPHHCDGCFNKESWDYLAGKHFTDETYDYIINLFKEKGRYLSGLTLLGGEPFAQNKEYTAKLCSMIDEIKKINKKFDFWAWTGYNIEDIINSELLKRIDVLIDGPFKKELKDLTLKYRGSSNQRIINVKSYLKGE